VYLSVRRSVRDSHWSRDYRDGTGIRVFYENPGFYTQRGAKPPKKVGSKTQPDISTSWYTYLQDLLAIATETWKGQANLCRSTPEPSTPTMSTEVPKDPGSPNPGDAYHTGLSLVSPARRRRSRRILFQLRNVASALQALQGWKLPILARFMYHSSLNLRSPSSPMPIWLPEWKRNQRNRRRTRIAFLSPALNCSSGRSEKEITEFGPGLYELDSFQLG
jgi:hypothetical protein